MQITTVSDPITWNQALLRLPQPPVLQSGEWGAFKTRHGWEARGWLFADGACGPKAAALVLRRKLPRLPWNILYVPKGPVLDYADADLLNTVLGHLEHLARQQRALFIKIDPDIPIGSPIAQLLRQRGWHPSAEQIQFRNTMLVDLRPSEETLLKAMKAKWRYNIRLSKRKGVQVRLGSLDDLSLLYQMYRETSVRDGFVIRPPGYYHDAWGSFIEAGLAQPFVAEYKSQPLAMVIIFCFGERAWYMYGASRNQHRDKMPNHLLQWEAMRWVKSRGGQIYDMWGAPDELDESDSMWGVYRFKQGFGAEMARHIGAYDYPTSRLGHQAYTVLAPRLLSQLRRLYWRRAS